MPVVVDHLADLTAFRDRDRLDATLAGALKDLLLPDMVALFRCVGEESNQRWLSRAQVRHSDILPSADPLWTDLEELPLLQSHGDRLACLRGHRVVQGPPGQKATATSDGGTGAPASAHVTYFPLVNAGQADGVLEVHTRAPLEPKEQHLVSGVLRVYSNFQSLLDDNERDMLTRLLNRKTFDACFWRAIAATPNPHDAARGEAADLRQRGGPGTAWLSVIDIDHFKRVNDNFGHLIGDEVLLLLSRLMRSSFRLQDQLFRFGGEEFVVLMQCPDQASAAATLERLRLTVQRQAFPQVQHITISLGYTQLRAGDTPQSAFERADQAVYYAKQHGRNQVSHHEALVGQGELQDAARNSDVELF